MSAILSGLAASLATIFISAITHHLKQRISYGERWKKKKEQFDDIILKARELTKQHDINCAERAYLENSIFSKFGWPMPAEAVTYLLTKKDFPYNLEMFHKSRRDIEFSEGKFRSKVSGLGEIFASPKESHIKAVVRIALTLNFSWGLTAIALVIINLGFQYPTPTITAAFATFTPLALFALYLLGTSTNDMRRNKRLLDLNNSANPVI
ncbi:hypothetical protein QEN58_09755 [Halomonas alkaliantarctica]|uniref:Uncharacterized protein n=1 Tax=Halomonas alkaliantarctica TaxID=232346 RepID=A0ABY8LGP5_9GAMM|nr:hypothetical protein [Halomonas alkaliantarctica]WGI23641.1 hypothetical protein QEN58_09755 [Halomonas alkaliantarctica]